LIAIAARQLEIEDGELQAVAERVALAAHYNGQATVEQHDALASELGAALRECLHRYVRPGQQ
jgi:hypothetical protein